MHQKIVKRVDNHFSENVLSEINLPLRAPKTAERPFYEAKQGYFELI